MHPSLADPPRPGSLGGRAAARWRLIGTPNTGLRRQRGEPTFNGHGQANGLSAINHSTH